MELVVIYGLDRVVAEPYTVHRRRVSWCKISDPNKL
jgi:hypothetical protein